MDKPEIECEECGWQGFATELHCSDEEFHSHKSVDEITFNLCPDCGSDKIYDIDDD